MAENLGIDWLVPPDEFDADIGVELACAGREAIFGFDMLGELFSGPASLAMRERCLTARRQSHTKRSIISHRGERRGWMLR